MQFSTGNMLLRHDTEKSTFQIEKQAIKYKSTSIYVCDSISSVSTNHNKIDLTLEVKIIVTERVEKVLKIMLIIAGCCYSKMSFQIWLQI